jgi:ABC-type nitrate/sulfonate/bicarbonate transport system substrate-binding protein
MFYKSIAFVFVTFFALTGCSAANPTPVSKGTLRVGYPTIADTADVPSLMAQEQLPAQGYNIEQHFFENPETLVATITRGDLDFSHGSTSTHWAAVDKGADIFIVSEQAGNVWSLVARPALQTCADLEKQKIGVNSAGSISNALVQAYVKQNCPGVTPEMLYMSGSELEEVSHLNAVLHELGVK